MEDKNELFDACIMRRIFPIVGDITEQMIDQLKRAIFQMLVNSATDPINLVFDTHGGTVRQSKCGYDFIKSVKAEISGFVIGSCDSAGLILLAGCSKEKRFALQHSRFLFHAIESGINIKSTGDPKKAVEIFMKGHLRLCEDVKNIYLKEYYMNARQLDTLMKEGEFYDELFTDEARKFGVISEIITELPFNF